MVTQLDAKIGAFVAALERTGQREKTLIIFTSDNGGIESLQNAYVGDVPHSPFNSENDPLRGQKNTLYEGGTRVCAFAHWSGKLKPSKIAALPVLPEPVNGSRTTPPGGVTNRTSWRSRSVGFTVG
jgi:arylsulfatase A-like enzyme